MSVRAITAVWDMLGGSPEERLVLLAYADHADDEGASIFPAVARVARKTGLTERSVQRITRRLTSAGLLLPDGSGPKGTRRWRMPLPLGGDGLSPLPDRVTLKTEGVTPATDGGVVPVTRTVINRQEPSDSRPSGRKSADDALRKSLEAHFSSVTNLPIPKTDTEARRKEAGRLWYAPLRELAELCGWDEAKAKRLVSEVVKRMKNDRLTISDPNSLVKIARSLAAEVNRAAQVPEFLIPPNQRA